MAQRVAEIGAGSSIGGKRQRGGPSIQPDDIQKALEMRLEKEKAETVASLSAALQKVGQHCFFSLVIHPDIVLLFSIIFCSSLAAHGDLENLKRAKCF